MPFQSCLGFSSVLMKRWMDYYCVVSNNNTVARRTTKLQRAIFYFPIWSTLRCTLKHITRKAIRARNKMQWKTLFRSEKNRHEGSKKSCRLKFLPDFQWYNLHLFCTLAWGKRPEAQWNRRWFGQQARQLQVEHVKTSGYQSVNAVHIGHNT